MLGATETSFALALVLVVTTVANDTLCNCTGFLRLSKNNFTVSKKIIQRFIIEAVYCYLFIILSICLCLAYN